MFNVCIQAQSYRGESDEIVWYTIENFPGIRELERAFEYHTPIQLCLKKVTARLGWPDMDEKVIEEVFPLFDYLLLESFIRVVPGKDNFVIITGELLDEHQDHVVRVLSVLRRHKHGSEVHLNPVD